MRFSIISWIPGLPGLRSSVWTTAKLLLVWHKKYQGKFQFGMVCCVPGLPGLRFSVWTTAKLLLVWSKKYQGKFQFGMDCCGLLLDLAANPTVARIVMKGFAERPQGVNPPAGRGAQARRGTPPQYIR